jgi:hypothetical protein
MSRNQKRFWRALDRLAGGAVMAEWTQELADELERAQPLLRLLPGLAASHPCVNVLGCGEPHRAEEIEPGRWAAVGGSEHSCPPFRLERKDLFVFDLDTARLGSRIAGALGLGAVNGRKPGQVRAEVVGAYGAAGWPVYLMLPGDRARMMREVERLFGAQPDPFVLLTPTGVHCSPDVETMLRRQCCMHIALSSAVVLDAGGALSATMAVGPLLAEFLRRQAERPKVAPLLEALHRKIDAEHAERAELRVAKARLEQVVAEGLLKFLGRVDAQSLRIAYAVLAKGDIAKAARELKMKDSTLREFVVKWKGRGRDYAALADLVRWRKDTKFTGTVPLNEAVFAAEPNTVNYQGLLEDVLEGLLMMTEGNWEDKREELAELLRPVAA